MNATITTTTITEIAEITKSPEAVPKYKRILLKLSGEALMGDRSFGIDPEVVQDIALQVAEIVKDGIEVAIVVGGGNIFRGINGAAKGMDRATADYIGMIATVMNALTLQDALEHLDEPIQTRVMSAIAMQEIAEPYICLLYTSDAADE